MAPSDNGRAVQPVVAGVLTKYVNIAKGWRERFFVLSGDQLLYFKLKGRRAVNVQSILEQYDRTGAHTKLIGATVFMLHKDHMGTRPDDKAKTSVARTRSGIPHVHAKATATAAGVYDLKHAKLRESGTESHKFYLKLPQNVLVTLKTETPDDRVAWISALTVNKVEQSSIGSMYPAVDTDMMRCISFGNGGLSGASSFAQQDAAPRLSAVLADLQKEGLSAEGAARITAEFAALKEALDNSQKQLQKQQREIQVVQDELRQVQTVMVAEHTQWNGEVAPLADSDDHETSSEQPDLDEDAASVLGSDASGDVFYDASQTLRSPSQSPSSVEKLAATPGSQSHSAPPTNSKAPAVVTAAAPDAAAVPPRAQAWPEATTAADKNILVPAWLEKENPVERREALPQQEETEKSVSLWALIKECIGKDLTRICLPVFFNEPLSALQKMAEEFEYAELLERAAKCPRASVDRLIWIAVFAVSGYSGSNGRTCKPFNPLLGETFAHIDTKRRFRFVAEKVVHHPTVLAAVCEGVGWKVAADLEVKSKFWGRFIELKPVGRIECVFHDGEVITWNKVTTSIRNLILGKIYVEHSGTMKVQSEQMSLEFRIKFKDSGIISSSMHEISGRLHENGRDLHTHKLEGVWDEAVTLDTGTGPVEMWHAGPPAKDPMRYQLSRFAIELNELTPGLKSKLPPTDCRLRPDQAALERGKYDLANAEKQRLEKKQRRARKEAEEGKPLHPRWFQPVNNAVRGEHLSYAFTGEYWQQQEQGKFTGCRDIFGPDEPTPAQA